MTVHKTCGTCPHMKLNNMGRFGVIAYCGITDDEMVVPHQYDGNSVITTRVPEFCKNHDAKPSKNPAKKSEQTEIKL